MDFDLDLSTEVLRRTPATLQAFLDGLGEPWVRGIEGLRFEPYDRFRHRMRNSGRSLESLLAEFARLRATNLELLRSWKLTARELDLPGDHPSLGRVTLRQLLAAWVVHDLGHVAQVARVMAKQYRDEVGPWMPLLPVLTDHMVPRS